MIEYEPRYSDTDDSDHMGRWSRIAYVNDIQIAWINRISSGGVVKYGVYCNFPTRKRTDVPNENKLFDDFFDAKFWVGEKWCEFRELIK